VRRALAIASICLAAALGACGDDEDDKKSDSGTAAPSEQLPTTPAPTQTEPTACKEAAPPAGEEREAKEPKDGLDEGKTYSLVVVTNCGEFTVRLDPKLAPRAAASLVSLAEQKYFDGTPFHRIVPGFVIQGGDPTGTGGGGPGYSIPDELKGNESYTPGTLAMANAGPNTGGSQFFVITGPNGSNLDGNPNYTIFGRVVEGLGVAQRIQQLPILDPDAAAAGDLSGQRPRQAVYIEKVTIRETGGGK
jgi:cyclophilin family peptidyl-prolyl cis-trans isomerase